MLPRHICRRVYSVLEIKNALIRDIDNPKPLYINLNLNIRENESWAIVGPVACGKSTLLKVIRGLYISEPPIKYPFIESLNTVDKYGHTRSTWPSHIIQTVEFKSSSSSALYYSERYESFRDKLDPTLRDYLNGRVEHIPDVADSVPGIDELANRFHMNQLLNQSLMNLSNGQNRRAKIMRALLKSPELLLLDEPYMGLDVEARQLLSDILAALARDKDPRVLLALRIQDEIPEFITHVLELGGDKTVLQAGPKEQVVPRLATDHYDRYSRVKDSYTSTGKIVADLANINVVYENQKGRFPVIENLNWTIRQGERWALTGPNGSGKTTLLSMITGDHPKSWANDITLFGTRRGIGDSVFNIQSKIGHVSPEIHFHFPSFLNLNRAIATGFTGSFDPPRPISNDQQLAINEILKEFELEKYSQTPFKELSTGQQRLALFLRAVIKSCPLIVMDEPFQGMDAHMIDKCRKWLDSCLKNDQALILISHYEHEWPSCINQIKRL